MFQNEFISKLCDILENCKEDDKTNDSKSLKSSNAAQKNGSAKGDNGNHAVDPEILFEDSADSVSTPAISVIGEESEDSRESEGSSRNSTGDHTETKSPEKNMSSVKSSRSGKSKQSMVNAYSGHLGAHEGGQRVAIPQYPSGLGTPQRHLLRNHTTLTENQHTDIILNLHSVLCSLHKTPQIDEIQTQICFGSVAPSYSPWRHLFDRA